MAQISYLTHFQALAGIVFLLLALQMNLLSPLALPLTKTLPAVALSLLIGGLVVYAPLKKLGWERRTVQSLMGIFGIDVFVCVCLKTGYNLGLEGATFIGLLAFLSIWTWAVKAFVFKHTFHLKLFWAFLATIGYELLVGFPIRLLPLPILPT